MTLFIQLLLAFFTSFFLCFFAIPTIIQIAKEKHLFDEPGERKVHIARVPTLGGVGIGAGFLFSTTFWASQNDIVELQYIIASLIILFAMGIKDDIVGMRALPKLGGQLVAALIIVLWADVRLRSLYGLFEIHEIPFAASVVLSVLTVVAITNAYNLIDGIDTLAGSVGVCATMTFGTWFYFAGHPQYAVLSYSMGGALTAFLWYNWTPARIFMGDTGSLVVGFVNAVLAIQFMEFNRSYAGADPFVIQSVPAVTIGILIIPIFDTMRVFVLRILAGRSPLRADRNHLHHILVDRGYTHLRASGLLVFLNGVVVLHSYAFQEITGELLLVNNMLILSVFSVYHTWRRRKERGIEVN